MTDFNGILFEMEKEKVRDVFREGGMCRATVIKSLNILHGLGLNMNQTESLMFELAWQVKDEGEMRNTPPG